MVKAKNSLSRVLGSGFREVSLRRKAHKQLPNTEHHFGSTSVNEKKVSMCLKFKKCIVLEFVDPVAEYTLSLFSLFSFCSYYHLVNLL